MGPFISKAAILMLVTSICNGVLPEDDFRIINKQDLLAKDSDIFEDKSSKSFSQLLFDVARDQVIVGARDAIYRLSLRGLRSFEKADWPAAIDKAKMCQVKGQTEDDCHNYIKILLSAGHKLFVCGTNAFSPQCSWREIESVGTVLEWVTGVANCPYNPHSNATAILSSSGHYYTGTSTDFAGSDTGIFRSSGYSQAINILRTGQYDLNWLNEPQFVGSFEHDQFVYFVYREVAVEFMNCGNIVYSRIARVCKNDSGGHLMMRDKWSTFLKARLNCSVPGEYPFYYDEVQSIQYMDDQKLMVAVFTTPDNSIAGSAVCFYNISDITAAFEGSYKIQTDPASRWTVRNPTPRDREHFRCKRNSGHHDAIQYQPYQLMADAIQPIQKEPLYKSTLQRFTHVTADTTLTKTAGRQFVTFVATDESDILKLVVLPQFKGACLVETWRLKDYKNGFHIQNIQFVKDTMSIYIGSESSVLRIGVHRCARYLTRAACIGAADPYCGWDDARNLCVEAVLHVHETHFAQNTDHCPLLEMPVDGGWSSWSDWVQCVQDNEFPEFYEMEKPNMCMCRTRRCDNPKPANGGRNCQGSSISVRNCTVHGGWSAWSAWSECSATCGIAIKSRRRSCTSPAPAYGGRSCVGQNTMELYCPQLPPCPDPELAPVDGGWSQWGPWSPCTGTGCGPNVGWKERRRTCSNPEPKYNGADCEGNKMERVPCDLRACEIKKTAAWTPWVQIPGNNSDGSYIQKRFKVMCKAPASEQLKLSVGKEEEQYCSSSGSCSNQPPSQQSGWGEWGTWTQCSAECGGGQQTRRRECHAHCRGDDVLVRICNTQPCVRAEVQIAGMGVSSTVGCILLAYIFGCVTCMAAVVFCVRRNGTRYPWKRCHGVPSSPHYITANQNSYVTVPLKPVPRKAKRQPSFSGIGSSGTLLTKSNNLSNNHNHNNTLTTPKLYPKAIANEYDTVSTLKRHSQQPNNRNNVDYEEDKFY